MSSILLVAAVATWMVMLGLGIDPWLSFGGIIVVAIGLAVVSGRYTSRLRHASAAAWTWRSALSPVEGDALLEARLVEIADLLESAARRLDAGETGRDQYMRVWRAAFDEVSALQAAPGRALR